MREECDGRTDRQEESWKTEGQAYEETRIRQEARERNQIQGLANSCRAAVERNQRALTEATGSGCCAAYACREYGSRRPHCCEHQGDERALPGGCEAGLHRAYGNVGLDSPRARAYRAHFPGSGGGLDRQVEAERAPSEPEGRDLSGEESSLGGGDEDCSGAKEPSLGGREVLVGEEPEVERYFISHYYRYYPVPRETSIRELWFSCYCRACRTQIEKAEASEPAPRPAPRREVRAIGDLQGLRKLLEPSRGLPGVSSDEPPR